MPKETYTKEEVIELLVKERTRARSIAYAHKEKHEAELGGFKILLNDNSIKNKEFVSSMVMKHKNLVELSRIIGNTISGSTALSLDETMEDRIKKEYDL